MADNIPAQIGRYEVVRRLGRGGMGVVYLARDPFIEREVAIKLLRAIDDDEAQERFQREIRIAGALSHPNVVRIYDAGTHDGQPFVAMEYVNGQTLSEVIKAGVALELDRKIEMLLDLADGLGYAHKRGVIHRDIKPSNLIVDDHGALKILDFGIARLSDAGRTSLSAVGTPSYMAPEQILGETVDARCDLFSFGVVVYELVAYRQPFTGDTEHSVYHRILNSEPRPLTEVAPGTPASLDTFMRTALAKKADERFQTAKALADELRAIRASLTADETIVVARPKAKAQGAAVQSPSPFAMPQTGPLATPGRSPASRRLADLRERQMQAAKDDARRALAEGRAQDALEAAERALVLDEEDVSAHELAEMARKAIERTEARRALAQAEQHLKDGDLTRARQVVEQARALVPDDTDLAAMDQRIAHLVRDREAAAQRALQVRDAIARARQYQSAGDLESALTSVGQALGIEPNHAEALALKSSIEAGLRTRRAEAQWHEAARQTCARARELAGRGGLDEALHLLSTFSPAHPIVTGLVAELRTRQAVLADEHRRRAAEAERTQRRAQAIEHATRLISANDPDGALRVLADLRAAGVVDDEVVVLEQRASDLRLSLAQQRRREAMLARGLETVRALIEAGDADAALLAIEQLEGDGFAAEPLRALKRDAQALQERLERDRQEQLARERRAARLATGLADVRRALERRDAEAALAALGLLRREGFAEADLAEADRAAAALREQLAGERQQQIERERQAARLASGLEIVRAGLGAGDPDSALAAIALLRREGFEAPEFAALEREAQELQRNLSALRHQEIEQQRRASRLSRGASEIQAALKRRDADAAAAALALLEREGFGGDDLAPYTKTVRALQEQIERERQAQIEKERRAARLARALADARAALQRREPDAALAIVEELEREQFDTPDVARLKKDAKTQKKQVDQERKTAAASAAATAAASGAAGGPPAPASLSAEPWETPSPAGASSKLPLIAAGALLVILLIAGGVWAAKYWAGQPSTQTDQGEQVPSPPVPKPTPPGPDKGSKGGETEKTVSTDTGGETKPAPTPTPAPPPSPPPPKPAEDAGTRETNTRAAEAARLVGEAVRLESRGDLRQAARMLGQALSMVPESSAEGRSAATRLRSVVNQARQRAARAEQRAQDANAVTHDDYRAGGRASNQARGDGDTEAAVAQWLDAEAAFDRARTAAQAEAARREADRLEAQRKEAERLEAQRKEAERLEAERKKAADEAAKKATPPTPPAGDFAADRKLVDQLVRRYFAARSSLDVGQVQQVYPNVPVDRERDILRGTERACSDYSESPTNVSVLSITAQEAVVRSSVQVTCRQSAGGRQQSIPPVDVYITLRKAGAAWQISQVNRPDRTGR